MHDLAKCGVKITCYNFMPILDWTRTNLSFELPNGAKCMRNDTVNFAAFDIHVLERKGAIEDFTPQITEEAEQRFAIMNDT